MSAVCNASTPSTLLDITKKKRERDVTYSDFHFSLQNYHMEFVLDKLAADKEERERERERERCWTNWQQIKERERDVAYPDFHFSLQIYHMEFVLDKLAADKKKERERDVGQIGSR